MDIRVHTDCFNGWSARQCLTHSRGQRSGCWADLNQALGYRLSSSGAGLCRDLVLFKGWQSSWTWYMFLEERYSSSGANIIRICTFSFYQTQQVSSDQRWCEGTEWGNPRDINLKMNQHSSLGIFLSLHKYHSHGTEGETEKTHYLLAC